LVTPILDDGPDLVAFQAGGMGGNALRKGSGACAEESKESCKTGNSHRHAGNEILLMVKNGI
jgi:hypothetical protein